MIKVEKSNKKHNPFGGINFVIDDIKEKGLCDLIDNQLNERTPQAIYKYSDVLIALWSIFLCGGDAAEDIETHLREQLLEVPDMNVMSADTILRVLKELKTDKKIHNNDGVIHEYNDNIDLNKLNIKIQKQVGLIREDCLYDYDFDHQFIPTDKFDSKVSYKKKEGYFPGIATINDLPVYIENRNGNSNVKYLQYETLEKSYKALKEENIRIYRTRADCGSYSKKVINVIEEYSKLFYIRAQKSDYMRKEIENVKEWKEVIINNITHEVASVDYIPFGGDKTYRLIIQRTKQNQGQGNLFTEDARVYRSILSNDNKSSEKEIIEFYNARGTSEKVFDVMNNDFG
ncbi:MAG: IS1380 family transposase [bacterium]|nr:IS1380 family transposase [bacterium]